MKFKTTCGINPVPSESRLKAILKTFALPWLLAGLLGQAGGGNVSAAALVWHGTSYDNNNWDTNLADANWQSGAVLGTNFNNGDSVIFNNNGAGSPNVNIVGSVQPAAITVVTSSGSSIYAYAFTNATGTITGSGSLLVTGAGRLTIATANSYSGGTTVDTPATLFVGAATNLGTGATTLMGGTLGASVNGLQLQADSLMVPGGTNGLIILTNEMKLPALSGSGTLGLAVHGTTPANSSGNYGDCLSACANFNGTLDVTGMVATAVLVCNFNNVGGGTFDGQLQNATVNLFAGAGGGVSLEGMDNGIGNIAQIGALNVDVSSSLGGSQYAGTLTYQIGALGTPSVINGAVSGNGAIIKVGAGTLTLAGANSYSGSTTINAGVLALTGASALSNSPTLTLAAGAVLDVSGRTDGTLTLATNQTLNGNGTLNGSLVESANSRVNVGLDTFTVTNLAALVGTNTFQLNRTNATTHSEIAAAGFTAGGALIMTNLGPVLNTGDTFKLFNQPVGPFAGVTLPVSGLDPGSNVVTYAWTNRLAVDGTIQVLSGYVPPSVVSSNAVLTSLTLSPAAVLTPAFATNVFSYTATEPYNSLIAVTVTNADLTATNQLTINSSAPGLLASGVPSSPAQALNPNPGVTNVVTVQVTAQDGMTVNTYTVDVVQLPSQTQPLITKSVSAGTLTLNWPLANLGYRLLEQTNNLNRGVSASQNDWMTVPGSTATNTAAFSISKTNLDEYYQLVYP